MNWNTENFSIAREFARDIIWESRQKQEINNAGPAPPVSAGKSQVVGSEREVLGLSEKFGSRLRWFGPNDFLNI